MKSWDGLLWILVTYAVIIVLGVMYIVRDRSRIKETIRSLLFMGLLFVVIAFVLYVLI
ncbi:hypothetical protein D3C76_1169940 [compost metagenome]